MQQDSEIIDIISIFENLSHILENDLWVKTVVYDCYDIHGNAVLGKKQFPIFHFIGTIPVYNKEGKQLIDINNKPIFIAEKQIGVGDEPIKVATGDNYLTRLYKYKQFLDIVRDMRLTLYDSLGSNKDSFQDRFWVEMNKILKSDQARFTRIFLNMFFYTYNPMFDDSEYEQSTPFILFDFQYDFIKDAIDSPLSLLVIKPRGFGFTWLKIGLDLVNMFFIPNWQGIVISRVESDLDAKDDRVQTIFGRMRFAMEKLPFDIIQYGRDKQRFIKLANGSQYMGKSSNVDSARSMRGDLVELEEAGALERLIEMVRSIKSVAKKRIIGGSVKGVDNGFYEFYQNALTDGSYKIILWTIAQHPLYSAPDWLHNEKISYGVDEAGFNQEVLADFFAGVMGQVFLALHKGFVVNDNHFIDLHTSEYWIKCSSIDPAFGSSKTAIWTYYFNSITREYYYTAYYEMENTSYDKIIELMTDIGALESLCFIDEHANKRDKDGITLTNMLRMKGMVNIVSVSNKQVRDSCFFGNSLINDSKIWFKADGVDVNKNRVNMTVGGFSKLLRYRFNNKNGFDKVGASIIDKDGKNDDAGDSFRYSHSASKYIGRGILNSAFSRKHTRQTHYAD